jgi:predicted  nucleic acid-binding Zn-ribbon protein
VAAAVEQGIMTTRDRIAQRLQELRAEAESGRRVLADLDAKRADVQQTFLRISGAIQVLEELLAADQEDVAPGNRQKPGMALPNVGDGSV